MEYIYTFILCCPVFFCFSLYQNTIPLNGLAYNSFNPSKTFNISKSTWNSSLECNLFHRIEFRDSNWEIVQQGNFYKYKIKIYFSKQIWRIVARIPINLNGFEEQTCLCGAPCFCGATWRHVPPASTSFFVCLCGTTQFCGVP